MEENSINILLAEDDKNLGTILRTYLQAKGFPTTLVENGEQALEAFDRIKPSFCIFDIMMPIMDGYALAKEIRNKDKRVPILFLTAKTMQDDVLSGFEAGADDYMTKPFSMEELLVRVKAIYRRAYANKGEDTEFRLGSFVFDYSRRYLTNSNGEVRRLTSREADLLVLLCQNKNQVLERSVALKKVWNEESYFNARSMDVYITKLRKYFKADPDVEIINIHGIGFKLYVK